MTNNINEICTLYIANRDALKKAFPLESTYILPSAANKLAAAGVTADVDSLKETKKIMKAAISSISYLRGASDLPLLVEMYLAEDAKAAAERIEAVYKIFKKHFTRSEYLAFLAILLGQQLDDEKADALGVRAKKLYDMMKKEHPILTGSEDSTMAGFMALSDKDDEQLITECEECFDLLKKKFSAKGSVQSCSQIFAIADNGSKEKADKMIALYDLLKEGGRKFDKFYGLPVLAAVSLCEQDIKTIADTMLEIDEFLKTQKGYNPLIKDKQTRLLHAAMLTSTAFGANENSKTATLAMMAAQQAAECAMITCAIVASTSAANAAN